MKKVIHIAAFLILTLAAGSYAEAPNLFTYQGRLKEGGQAVSGNRMVEIFLCNDPSAGSCEPTGPQPVAVSNGLFRSTFTAPAAVNFGTGGVWLEIWVAGTKLTPRERLTSGAYSLFAATAAYAENIAAAAGSEGVYISSNLYVTGGGKYYGNGSQLSNIIASSIAINAVLNESIVSLSASKLTGALPAIDGSLLTSLPVSGGAVAKTGDIMSGTLTMNGASALTTGTQKELVISTNIYSVGYSSAAKFYGDGSSLTGVAATTIADGVVTTAKMANMATASILGRSSAGTGTPEVLGVSAAKTMLAINNIDNTSDANKPVSTAQQSALDLKADVDGAAFTGVLSAANLSGTNTGDQTDIAGNAGTATNATNHIADVTGGVHGAASANTANMIVRRDGSGNFAAGTIVATGLKGPLLGDVDGNVTGSAGTAGALSADPVDCALPSVALGINASGTAQCSQPSDISGNAATVTNGVYTAGNQTISGIKTFSGSVSVPDNAFSVGGSRLIATGGMVGINGVPQAGRHYSENGSAALVVGGLVAQRSGGTSWPVAMAVIEGTMTMTTNQAFMFGTIIRPTVDLTSGYANGVTGLYVAAPAQVGGNYAIGVNTLQVDQPAIGKDCRNGLAIGAGTGCTSNSQTSYGINQGGASYNYLGSNTGIGAALPDQKLTVNGNISQTGVLISSGAGSNYFAGKVGIGTAIPGFQLDVTGDVNATGSLYVGANATISSLLKASSLPFDFQDNNNFSRIRFQSANTALFDQSDAQTLTLAGGSAGIGTALPNQKLTVAGNISQTGVLISSGTGSSYFAGSVGIGTSAPVGPLQVTFGPTSTALTVASDGVVVLGAASGSSAANNVRLHSRGGNFLLEDGSLLLRDSSVGNKWELKSISGALQIYQIYNSAGGLVNQVRLNLLDSGSLGVGAGTPDQKLTVAGNISQTGVLISSGAGDNYFAGNVGIGDSAPNQKLVVAGGIKLGDAGTNTAGTMRYNGGHFQGGNGTAWANFDVSAGGWATGAGTIYPGTLSDSVGIGIIPSGHQLQVYSSNSTLAQHGIFSRIYPGAFAGSSYGPDGSKSAIVGIGDSNGAVTREFGVAGYLTGASQTDSAGVFGGSEIGTAGTSPLNWGALGYRDAGGSDWAGYFNGKVKVNVFLADNITTAFGLRLGGNANFKTVTDWYGMYIESPADTTNVANKYAFVTAPNSGNVGIGTVSPAAALNVAGTVLVNPNYPLLLSNNNPFGAGLRNDPAGNESFIIAARNTATKIFIATGYDVSASPGMTLALPASPEITVDNGKVGVGTTSPGYKLDVQGGSLNASASLCIAGNCRSSWPQRSVVVYKPADTSISNDNIPNPDPDLKFYVGPGEKWVFEFTLYVYSNDTTYASDFRAGLQGPAANQLRGEYNFYNYDGTAQQAGGVFDAYVDRQVDWSAATPATGTRAVIKGTILNGGVGGDLTVTWSANTMSAYTTTVLKGSYLVAHEAN